MVKVRRVDSEVLRCVRHKVLWPHLANSKQAIIDIDHRKDSIHLAAFFKNDVVGVASLFNQKCERFPDLFKSLKVRRLRAMGVLDNRRGEGVGALIIQKSIEELKGEGVEVIWCDAREVAWGFYQIQGFKFGCQINGEELEAYQIPNVGLHKIMFKSL